MNTDSPSQEHYRDEYKIVFEAYKFFVSLRFIAVAFGVSIHSALFTIYNQAVKESRFNGVVVFGVAIVLLIALVIIEQRTISAYKVALKRGTELEFQLGLPNSFFHRITELSVQKGLRKFITHTWGIKLVYIGVFTLWVMLLVATITK